MSDCPHCASHAHDLAQVQEENARLKATLNSNGYAAVVENERANKAEAACLAARQEVERLKAFLERAGYRRCDIPACNCNSWHGGHAYERLRDIETALNDADVSTNGRTILKAVQAVLADLTACQAQLAQERDRVRQIAERAMYVASDPHLIAGTYRSALQDVCSLALAALSPAAAPQEGQ